MTECLIRSINKYTSDCTIYIFDNSDKYPFNHTQDNIIKFDNTKGQIINFNKWLDNYPYKGGESSGIFGSAKHSISIDKCFDLIDDNFILMDSDILLKQDVSPLWDEDYIYVGEVQSQSGSFIKRLLPFICFINVKKCKEFGIRYFDDRYMHGLNKYSSGNFYDTGANFFLKCKKYEHKEVRIGDYITHYKGGSWDIQHSSNKKVHGNLTQEDWLILNKKLWDKDTMNKKVIYSCITGDYEEIVDPTYVSSDFDYVCFTDKKNVKSLVWKFRPIPEDLLNLSKIKQQRCIKICPHKYLSEYDLSIWVDGSVDIISDVNTLIEGECSDDNKSVFIGKHPVRNCIYTEGDVCAAIGKDTRQTILPQMRKYKKDGFPERFGLVQSNIVIRKHNNPYCVKLMEMWKHELVIHSHRDQLSFNYCLWKLGNIGFKYLDSKIYNSKWFRWYPHHNRKQNRYIIQKPIQTNKTNNINTANQNTINIKSGLDAVNKRTVLSNTNKTVIELPPSTRKIYRPNNKLISLLS